VWRKWTETKHLYRNIHIPYFIKDSGDTDDDAILKCCKQHWLFKKNKNIKAHNSRMARLNRPRSEYRAEVTVDLAPDNLNQAGKLYPKAICYLIFKDHPILLKTPHHVKDSTLRNRMTAKGYFKSRNMLHASESDRKKKR
jgi:hypothetical protein